VEYQNTYQLNTIYFYLTDGCNLRCRHCWIAPKNVNKNASYLMLDFSYLCSIIDQGKPLGLSSVKLTGGEPLLHTKIYQILDFIKNNELSLNIETNGTLCSKNLVKKIRKCREPFISVSLDSTDASIHDWIRGVSGSFKATMLGIHNLVSVGLHPQIIMTLMKCNKKQLESIVNLAESIGADSVKFNLIQPSARGGIMYESGEALAIEELVELGDWVENDLSNKANIPIYYDHPPAFRPLSKLFASNNPLFNDSCNIFNVLGVLADGSYALCGIGNSISDLIFGHTVKHNLKDVWDRSPIIQDIRDGLPKLLEGICGECIMKGICLGSCIAQNYYREKSFWSPFWYCKEANNRGLFPKSRIVQKSI
jgi:SynChlorMet cassette radical SAM/SPASM protein ScmF